MKAIVVGSGISGLTSAWALIKRGWEVEILEAGPVPNPLAASWDFHRIIGVLSARHTGHSARVAAAFDAWDMLWDDLGIKHYVRRGILTLSRTPGDHAERAEANMKAAGVPFERLTPKEIENFGVFVTEGVRFGIHTGTGGALFSDRIVLGLIAWLRAKGVVIRADHAVTGLDAEAGVVTTKAGEHRGDAVIVAAGVGLGALFPDLAKQYNARRTTVVYLNPPVDLQGAWDRAPCWSDLGGDQDLWGLPCVAGLPLKIGFGLYTKTGDPTRERASFPADTDAIVAAYKGRFTGIERFTHHSTVTNFYLMAPDQRHALQRRGKVWIVTVDSGYGFKFGALTGCDVARAVDTGDPGGKIAAQVAGV